MYEQTNCPERCKPWAFQPLSAYQTTSLPLIYAVNESKHTFPGEKMKPHVFTDSEWGIVNVLRWLRPDTTSQCLTNLQQLILLAGLSSWAVPWGHCNLGTLWECTLSLRKQATNCQIVCELAITSSWINSASIVRYLFSARAEGRFGFATCRVRNDTN